MELALSRLALAYRSAMTERLRSEPAFAKWELRPPSMGTLRIVAAQGPISQRQVCQLLGAHASDMVGIIDQLEDCGLLVRERSTADRRRYDLTVTAKGQEAIERFLAVARDLDGEFYAVLSAAERAQLNRLLDKLVRAHSPCQ